MEGGNVSMFSLKSLDDYSKDVDFVEASYFKSNKELPTPTAVKALSQHYDRTFYRPQPVVFEDLNLIVKFGQRVSVSEALCLRAIKRTFGNQIPVPEVFGWRSEENLVFIYMQLVRGDLLHDKWDALSDEERLSICEQLRPMITSLREVEQDPADPFIDAQKLGLMTKRLAPAFRSSRFLCTSSRLRRDQELPFFNLTFSMASLSFDRKLAQAVSEDVNFTYRHITDSPTSCPPLFSPPPGVEAEQTECERHFFAVSINPEDKDGKSNDNDDNDDNHNNDDELFVFAIEVLIYTTPKLTTLFVSKADSTGYLYLLNSNSSTSTSGPSKTSSFIRNVSNAFLSHLVRLYQRSGTRLVLSLFARSQSQYLFPGSVENSHKHILDDRGLIKWWSRVVDPILRDFEAEEPSERSGPHTGGSGAETETSSASATAYLIVPGCDPRETRSFFPSSSRTDLPDKPRWVNAYPLHQICASPDAPPRSLVPRFPDDPKARFLTDLDEEVPDTEALRQNGQWRSVKTLEQFWELMAFRQECSAGRLVGFLWMVVNPTGVHKSDTLSGTVSSSTSPSNPKPMEQDSRKEDPRIRISNEDYDSLSDCLLDLDFADRDIGVKSTKQWLEKLSEVTGHSKQGRQVIGEAKPGSSMQSSSSHPPSQQVTAATTATPPTSNLLDSGLIRKRKRRDTNNNTETTPPAAIRGTSESEERQTGGTDGATLAQMQAQPTVNVLTASLIKKKKKREQG